VPHFLQSDTLLPQEQKRWALRWDSKNMTAPKPVIAVLGGTGALGRGLATRWARNGYKVIIGSRVGEKAENVAREMSAEVNGEVMGLDNQAAAERGEVIVLAVPFSDHDDIVRQVEAGLQGKVLIDVTVPLVPPAVGRVCLPDAGSAGKATQNMLGESVKVVTAFQNVAAHHLKGVEEIDCDVLVAGDDKAACELVIKLAEVAGMRAFYAGPIENSAAAEALTSVLIQINRQRKCHSGIRITGLADAH